ncbi:processed acidic surface protein [Parageobacillus thermoglucosidasius]|uniref:Processed acidic surface protein n=1 Tax=Parageobacillus thermoglucosidasius TaxID=1426 RepID=A0A1B7KR08_PARTM|nr:processed acidic surface protein [Parageobacillus thermoglucosidasius]OAT72470.1 processed acidic surface protein [Parageobacillus thermoglucosidasius]
MNRFCFAIIACFFFAIVHGVAPAFAQIEKRELEQYISSIGWTMNDLLNYLDDYHMTIADFQTMDELKQWLGTPIAEENFQQLLKRYQLTQEELEALLGQFGETVQDYTFIEDLDAAVAFYLRHNEQMQQINDMLGSIGFTEKEANRLFEHVASLHRQNLPQQLKALDARMEPFLQVADAALLTKQQRRQLFSIWEDALSALQIKPRFYLQENGKKQEVSYHRLLSLNTLGGRDLLIELYNQKGELLADVQLSEEILTSGYVFRAGEKFINASMLASEMEETMRGDKMPDTASPYLANMLLGLLLALFGAYAFWRIKSKAAE